MSTLLSIRYVIQAFFPRSFALFPASGTELTQGEQACFTVPAELARCLPSHQSKSTLFPLPALQPCQLQAMYLPPRSPRRRCNRARYTRVRSLARPAEGAAILAPLAADLPAQHLLAYPRFKHRSVGHTGMLTERASRRQQDRPKPQRGSGTVCIGVSSACVRWISSRATWPPTSERE